MNRKEEDILKTLFHRLPEDDLPYSFRDKMMEKIMEEALLAKKRNERIGLLVVILASVFMVAIAVLSILYMDLPKIDLPMPELTTMPFYIYIGVLVLILLAVDHMVRRKYLKKHSKDA